MMRRKERRDISIDVTFFYLKFVGFWSSNNQTEEFLRRFLLSYIASNSIGCMVLQILHMNHSWGNYDECIYIACNICSVGMVMIKVTISVIYRQELFRLITYAERNFWHSNYDPTEQAILNKCYRICTYLICVFSFFAQGTIVSYIIRPIVGNIGKNESDRTFPLHVALDLPLSMTPYFEITFMIEVFMLCHIGVAYLCVDNFLCLMNLHAASQFRILQHRLTKVYPVTKKMLHDRADEHYATFKDYVKQHQMLIAYCNGLEEAFNVMVLVQVLLFSLLICLDGYLILMDGASSMVRITFTFHITGCISQLLMFTYSCDCLIRDSTNVASAVYEGPWSLLPMDECGRLMRKDMLIVSMRARSPCCLTACGFFPVSLETYTKVLSTAVSYFTLLNSC